MTRLATVTDEERCPARASGGNVILRAVARTIRTGRFVDRGRG
jgi:hypothetical protein